MDWELAIEKNHEALKRILAMLVALVGMTGGAGGHRAEGQSSAGGQFTFFPLEGADASSQALAEKSKLSPALTLPRHLHRFVLRLLRPAEAATRRLIIIAARGLTVKVSPFRPRKPKAAPEPRTIYVLDRVNGSIVSVPMVVPERVPNPVPSRPASRSSTPAFPLLDPLKRFDRPPPRRRIPEDRMPRIRVLWGDDDPIVPLFRRPEPAPPPPPPTPDDPLDATRIHRRLHAIGRVLDDLPKQALRLARWTAWRDARWARERGEAEAADLSPCGGDQQLRPPQSITAAQPHAKPRRFHRTSPMRPGRPPGWRKRQNQDVYEVLNELHGLAVWLRDAPDTS